MSAARWRRPGPWRNAGSWCRRPKRPEALHDDGELLLHGFPPRHHQHGLPGFYGDIVHAEGAYNTSKEDNCFRKIPEGYSDMWWLRAFGRAAATSIRPTAWARSPRAWTSTVATGWTTWSTWRAPISPRAPGPRGGTADPFYEEFVDLPYRGNMGVALIRTVKGRP